jgi:hypothetical protein
MNITDQSRKLPPRKLAAGDWLRSIGRPAGKWSPPILVFIMAAGGTFAVILLREGPQSSSYPKEATRRAPIPSVDLGLRVGSDGERLLLSWNRQNPFLLSATGGTLVIQDGSQHREIHLDAEQLGGGSVAYKPLSNDVSFQLEVNGPQGSGTATMRVLDGTSVATPTTGVAGASQGSKSRP